MRVREKMMREIMLIKNINRKELMQIVGISESMLCHVIRGRKRFNLKQAKKLIEFFGADLMAKAINWEGLNVSNSL